MRAARIVALAAFGVAVASCAQAQPKTGSSLPGVEPSKPSAEQLDQGRYLVTLGDCVACHTLPEGAQFAGGRPLETPFGKVLSANITPDRETGIGNWTADQFYRALHEGRSADGSHLYPAFPYPFYTKLSRAQTDAIFAFLSTVTPVHKEVDRNQLDFPFSIRASMIAWNLLNFDKGEFKPDPSKSETWNRGAFLVEGPGHCAACHSPTNFMGARKTSEDYRGGSQSGWFAPDLTANKRSGVGGWTDDDLFQYLKTGRNRFGDASGEMGEVVGFSTSHMKDPDIKAIIAYLRDRPASPDRSPETPDASRMQVGEAVFTDACSACHRMDGSGVATLFPKLSGAPNLQQSDPTTLLHIILAGTRATPTDVHPTPFSMPAFAWKLDDAQIAAVATYVRNSWGNKAQPVSVDAVAKLRGNLKLDGMKPNTPPPNDLRQPTPKTVSPAGTDSRQNGTPDAGKAAQG